MDPLREALGKYETAYRKAVVHEANYKDLESLTKTVLAEAYHNAEGKSAKEKEMKALWSGEYIAHLTALSTARVPFLKWRAEKDITLHRWEMERSFLSANKSLN